MQRFSIFVLLMISVHCFFPFYGFLYVSLCTSCDQSCNGLGSLERFVDSTAKNLRPLFEICPRKI